MQERPLNAAAMAALAATALLGAMAVPYVPVLGLPLAAVALASLAASGRMSAAVVLALAGGAAASWSDPYVAVFTVPALLLAGPGVYVASRRWPAVSVMVAFTVVLFAASVASDSLSLAAHGSSIAGQARVASEQVVKAMSAVFATSGDASSAKLMRAELASLGKTAAMMWPSSYFVTSALTAVAAVIAATRAARAHDDRVNTLPPLAELDISVHFVWPVAIGLLALAASPVAGKASGIVLAVGVNLVSAVRVAFLAQGMGVSVSAMRKMGVSVPGRIIGSIVLVTVDFLTYAVSIVGLADMWMNFRRLPRDSGGQGGPQVSEQAP